MKSLRLFVLIALVVSSAHAATHAWTGTSNDRFSDSANWTGGSPAGDADAELLFPSTTGSRTPLNDIDGLTVRAISISAEGYAIGGKAITVTGEVMSTIGEATIACDLLLAGDVTFFVDSSVDNVHPVLNLDGAIRGSGRFIKDGGRGVRMRGRAPNSHSGGTWVRNGVLVLEKGSGVTCIPGDLRISTRVISHLAEQISDDAHVTFDPEGLLELEHNEAIRSLSIIGPAFSRDRTSVTVATSEAAALFVREHIQASGNAEAYVERVHLSDPLVVTLQEADFRAWFTGDAPLTVRGDGENYARLTSGHSSPTTLENVSMSGDLRNSAVTQRGGTFIGKARSLLLDGGELKFSTIAGELRLTATSKLEVSGSGPNIKAGGPIHLGNATLDAGALREAAAGTVVRVIEAEFGPVHGTFAGLPEGAVVNGYTITYRGGDGNDVELRAVPPVPTISVTDEELGDKTRITFSVAFEHVRANGRLIVRRGADVVGTVQLVNGAGSLDLSLPHGVHEFVAESIADAQLAAAKTEFEVTVRPPAPVIASIEPDVIRTGSGLVTVTIRGSNFLPDSLVSVADTIEYVSATELRVNVLSAGKGERGYTVDVTVWNVPGYVGSNSVELTFEPGPPRDPKRLTIGVNSIVAEVRPGATVAMAMAGYHPAQSERAWLTDSDGDGKVTWELTRRSAFFVCAVVDIATGEYFIEGSTTSLSDSTPLAPRLFRGRSGGYSNLVIPSMSYPHLLWVRRGVGAWFTDFDSLDDYRRNINGKRLLDAASLRPLGSSPSTPPAVELGDVFIALNDSYGTAYDAQIDASMLAPDVPGSLELPRFDDVREEDGVLRLPVFRLDGSAGTVSARLTTFDATARAGLDYQPVDQRVTLESGEMWKTVEIPVIDDALFADWRRFGARLTEPAGTTIAQAEAEIEIDEAEDPPRLRSDAVTVIEGDGPRSATTFVHLEGARRNAIEVEWSTSLSRAGGMLVFAPGETRREIRIPFAGNRIADGDRRFEIFLYAPEAGRADGDLTIIDDDVPRISVRDATVVEGNDRRSIELILDLDIGATRDVRVNWFTRDVTATTNVDYVASGGTTEFSGSPHATAEIEIPLLGEITAEGPESFEVVLLLPQGADIARSVARVTIADDDSMPTISIADTSGAEGRTVWPVLTLSSASSRPVTVNVSVVPGTATKFDYRLPFGTVTISEGQTGYSWLDVELLRDLLDEPDETFTIVLSNPVNANLGRASATVTIVDQPVAPPTVFIEDVSVVEGNTRDNTLLVRLSLSGVNPQGVRVGWSTVDDTATAGADYLAAQGEAIFLPYTQSANISIVIRGDTQIENDETLRIELTNTLGATIGRRTGVVTLVDDDGKDRRRAAGR